MKIFRAIIKNNQHYCSHRKIDTKSDTVLNNKSSLFDHDFKGTPDFWKKRYLYNYQRFDLFSEIKNKLDNLYQTVEKPPITIKVN